MKELLKKYKLYIYALIIAIIATISTSVSLYSLNKVNYEITLDKNDEIYNILLNDNKLNLSKYKNKCIKIDETLKVNCDTKIKLTSSNIDEVKVLTSSNINVSRNNKNNDYKGNYVYSKSKYEIIKSSINKFSLLLFIIYLIIYYLIIKLLKTTLNKINENANIKDIILFYICNFSIILGTIYLLLFLFKTLTLIFLIGYLLLILSKLKNKKIYNIYLVLSVIIGLTYVFLIPPFNVPDEISHFMKSYNMLEKTYKTDNGFAILKKDTSDFITYYEYTVLDSNEKFNGINYLSNIFKKDISKNKVVRNYSNTKAASNLPYLASSIAVKLGKTIGLSTLMLIIIARGINLLISILLGYYAIKIIPKYKKVLFIIMLLPCFIQASMGVNMDYLTNAISIFTISYILSIKDNKIDIKKIIILFVLALLIAFSKFGCFPIMLLVFLIPNKNFKIKINPLIIKIMLVLFVFLISVKLNSGAITISAKSIKTPYYSLDYVFKNPISTTNIFINTIVNRFDEDIYKGLFNSYGTYTKYTKSLFVTFQTIIISIILLIKEDNKKINIKERLLFIIISLMLIAIPYITMFLSWTNYGEQSIQGLQPRYFLVAAIMLFIGLSNNIFDIKIKDKNKLYTICIIITYIISLFTILDGFY